MGNDSENNGIGSASVIVDDSEYIVDVAINEYVANEEVAEYTTIIYKYMDEVGKRRQQINKMYNEVPDSHSLGLQFGSGHYLIIVCGARRGPDGKPINRSFDIRLGKSYDEYRRSQSPVSQQVVPHHNGGNSIDVATMMNFALVLVEKMRPVAVPQSAPVAALPTETMTTMYQNMNRLMFEQARDTRKMLSEIREEEGEPEPVKQEDSNDFAKQIIDLIKSVLPAMLNPMIARTTVNAAKRTPQYKQIANDPNLRSQVIDGLKRDIGDQKTNEVLKTFKLKDITGKSNSIDKAKFVNLKQNKLREANK